MVSPEKELDSIVPIEMVSMRISIAMATYNGENFLQRQLDSFLSQTRQPDELVVCDDGSSDDTLGILEHFRQVAPFAVRIYRNQVNLGFTKNFEQALTKCSGDLIFFSDQDDIWFPDKVAFVVKIFLANPDKLLVIHDGRQVDGHLVAHGVTKFSQVTAAYGSPNSVVMGALTAVKKELLSCSLPVPDGMVGHDVWLHNIAALLDSRLVIDKELQLIVRHGANTSGWIGSSVRKINKLDLWKFELKTTPATSYGDRILMNEASQIRLNKILDGDNSYSRKIVEKSLSHLRNEREVLRYRDRLVKSNWFKQKAMCLCMWFRGDYQYFNGVRSFMRDLVR
jgi:glycosyltransferase involved in cell wall biosynthesis